MHWIVLISIKRLLERRADRHKNKQTVRDKAKWRKDRQTKMGSDCRETGRMIKGGGIEFRKSRLLYPDEILMFLASILVFLYLRTWSLIK